MTSIVTMKITFGLVLSTLYVCSTCTVHSKEDKLDEIMTAFSALKSYVNDIQQSYDILSAEVRDLQHELKEQKTLSRQCVQSLEGLEKRLGSTTDARRITTNDVDDGPESKQYARSAEDKPQSRIIGGCHTRNIAFTALAASQSNLGQAQVLRFPDVLTNEEKLYNPHSSVFYCDVPGTYVFFVSITGAPSTRVRTSLVKDGSPVVHTHTPKVTGEYASASNMAVLHLNQGDSIWVETVDAQTGLAVDNWSAFSGFLLYPDSSNTPPPVTTLPPVPDLPPTPQAPPPSR